MKFFWAFLILSITALANSQAAPATSDTKQPRRSVADFGLVYPLSNDWVLATEMVRNRVESTNPPPNFDVLLAAVYVPKSDLSSTNPFFTLLAYRQPADCKKSLEAAIANFQDKKEKVEGGVEEFSAAGRDYFRINTSHAPGERHECLICTTGNGHLLLWRAGAANEKGLDAIVATLNSISSLPERGAVETIPPSTQGNTANEGAATAKLATQPVKPSKVRVSSGVAGGLLVKRVTPSYPAEARYARIQGTVVLKAEISKTGDITNLELVDGPIELAGSAVAAVRQWKYKPYLLLGEPVVVDTQIQVNYTLR
jgi:TonB family protein